MVHLPIVELLKSWRRRLLQGLNLLPQQCHPLLTFGIGSFGLGRALLLLLPQGFDFLELPHILECYPIGEVHTVVTILLIAIRLCDVYYFDVLAGSELGF